MQTTAIAAAIAAAIALALGLLAGSAYTGHQRDAAIARLERDHARQLAATADAASVRLYEAKVRQDGLTVRLRTALRDMTRLEEELKDAIDRTTDGRVCLREPALRVLHDAPGLRVAGLPDAGGGAAGADAGIVATDTDLARWARAAGRQYAECVERYHALIDETEAGAQ